MIAVDTNILVYAYVSSMPQHVAARAAMDRLTVRAQAWAIPWPCVHEFIAVVTNRKWHVDAPNTQQVIAHIDAWHDAPGLRFIGIGPDHWSHLRRVLEFSGAHGGQVHDARIVAVCEEAGVSEIWTADRDFTRFPGMRMRNPLDA